MPKIKNIFLDRDGTIIEEKYYLSNPKDVLLLPKVKEVLTEMQNKGLKIFLITNQSGIGRRYFTEKEFYLVQDKINLLLGKNFFQETLFCPHTPEDNCNCRKPKSGLFKQIQKKYSLKAEECVIIGDKICDILFGKNLNFALSCLVLTGHGQQEFKKLNLPFDSKTLTYQKVDFSFPLLIAKNLNTAWQAIKKLNHV